MTIQCSPTNTIGYSSNGANLSFPVEFGIGNGEAPVGTPNRIRDSWLVGLVNAGPYIGSAFLGCWLSDPCNFYFGRRGTIFISAIFCLLTPIGGAVSQTWEQLFITRLLMGIGMGKSPIYTCAMVKALGKTTNTNELNRSQRKLCTDLCW